MLYIALTLWFKRFGAGGEKKNSMGKKSRFLLGSSDHVLFKTTGPQCTSDIHRKVNKNALYCFYIVIKIDLEVAVKNEILLNFY